jgi:hypothetical protein
MPASPAFHRSACRRNLLHNRLVPCRHPHRRTACQHEGERKGESKSDDPGPVCSHRRDPANSINDQKWVEESLSRAGGVSSWRKTEPSGCFCQGRPKFLVADLMLFARSGASGNHEQKA